MKIGDRYELAIWTTGTETPEQSKHFRETQAPYEFDKIAKNFGVIFGELKFTYKLPGEDRVPQVPKHVSGPDVKLLVVEADVAGYRLLQQPELSSFTLDMPKKDLEKLRRITRQKCRENTGMNLTNRQCDEVIEKLGPDVAIKCLRQQANAR